jgi:hypothetical protein
MLFNKSILSFLQCILPSSAQAPAPAQAEFAVFSINATRPEKFISTTFGTPSLHN